ncbi:MAG TPA: TetR/AcrR family transcriptional regulator [Microlunatus sp.]
MHSQADHGARTLELLWSMRAPSGRGPRPRVTLDEIAAAGVAWADTHGLAGLTLARVAGELSLTASALYRHLDSKDALLALMVDQAIGDPPQLSGASWRDRCRDWTTALCQRYRQHSWVTQVQIAGAPSHPSAMAWLDLLLRELDQSPTDDPMRLAVLLDGLARAFALIDVTSNPTPPPEWLSQAIADRFPRLANELERNWTDVDDELAHAVDTVLTGSERLRTVQSSRP